MEFFIRPTKREGGVLGVERQKRRVFKLMKDIYRIETKRGQRWEGKGTEGRIGLHREHRRT